MATEWEYSVSFRVHHPSADPVAIADALEWRPQWTWKAGQPRKDGAGRPLSGTYSKSYCTFDLEVPENESLGAFLGRAVEYLGKRRGLLRELTETGGRLEFWVAIYVTKATGDELDASVVAQCGNLGVGIALLVSPFAMPHYEGEKGNVLPSPEDPVALS